MTSRQPESSDSSSVDEDHPILPWKRTLGASGVTAVVLTTGGMLASDLRHSPACATTLIVALGLLPGFSGAGAIAGGVVLLALLHWCLEQLPGRLS